MSDEVLDQILLTNKNNMLLTEAMLCFATSVIVMTKYKLIKPTIDYIICSRCQRIDVYIPSKNSYILSLYSNYFYLTLNVKILTVSCVLWLVTK